MPATVNGLQIALLRRIVGDGYRPTGEEAATVYALRSRRLITTTSAYAYWTAAPTDDGRTLASQCTAVTAVGTPPSEPGNSATAETVVGVPGSPIELVQRLQLAGGRLVVHDPSLAVRAAWRRLLHATRSTAVAADTMVLTYRGRDRGDLVIRLEARVTRPRPAGVRY